MSDLYAYVTSPARRQKAAAEQEQLRERFSHLVNTHPAIARYRFALGREPLVTNQLDALGPGRRRLKVNHYLYDQLAESYAEQGRFKEAETVTRDEERRKQYHQFALAMRRVGSKGCHCPDVSVEPSLTDAKGRRVPNSLLIDEIWDGTQFVKFSRCRLCSKIAAHV